MVSSVAGKRPIDGDEKSGKVDDAAEEEKDEQDERDPKKARKGEEDVKERFKKVFS